ASTLDSYTFPICDHSLFPNYECSNFFTTTRNYSYLSCNITLHAKIWVYTPRQCYPTGGINFLSSLYKLPYWRGNSFGNCYFCFYYFDWRSSVWLKGWSNR